MQFLSLSFPYSTLWAQACLGDHSHGARTPITAFAQKSGNLLVSFLSQNAVERFGNPASNARRHRRIRYKGSLSLGTD
jgi:hypothetical protein